MERLHKYMLEIEGVDAISDEMRAVIEDEWPELMHQLLPAKPQDRPAGERLTPTYAVKKERAIGTTSRRPS